MIWWRSKGAAMRRKLTPNRLGGLTVGTLHVKQVGPPDEEGDVDVGLKVPVDNDTDSILDVTLYLQALDEDGFEIADDSIGGFVPPGTKGFGLAGLCRWVKGRDYKRIAEWRLKEWSVYPVDPDGQRRD